MSTILSYRCDKCKVDISDVSKVVAVSVIVDHCMNGLPSSEAVWEEFDLCRTCSYKFDWNFVLSLSYEERKKWLKENISVRSGSCRDTKAGRIEIGSRSKRIC